MEYETYLWLVVCAGLVAAVLAFAIGANDVANAFATSVGSRAISMRTALLIAAVFEFTGSVALGATVTKTISGGIAKVAVFKARPDIFMYGMLCAMVAATFWILLATYFSLPVSTTHSIIGGVFGMALAYKGNEAIVWTEEIDEFPYYKGLGVIIVGWVVAPVVCVLVAGGFFFILRALVLRRENSIKAAVVSIPVVVFLALFTNVFFVLYKGVQSVHKFTREEAAWIAAVVAVGCAVLSAFCVPTLLKKVDEGKLRIMGVDDASAKAVEEGVPADKDVQADAESSSAFGKFKTIVMRGIDYDIHQNIQRNDVAEVHSTAEQFDGRAEGLYSYAQVFSACCVSFAHGANDVANSVGPFAAIYGVYQHMSVGKENDAPRWILVLGGVGIVVGLATYGYNVMSALGVESIKMTPSRGFLIEITTALVVSVGSAFGLPLSTTHCQVGGTWGVGLLEGSGGVNGKLAVKFMAGWIMTLVVAACLSAALFAQGVYSPSLNKPLVKTSG